MRFRSTLTPILLSATFAAAQPSVTEPIAPPPPPPAAPEPAPLPPPPVVTPAPPPLTVSGPPGAMPPIVINITNNNNGNNSNTNTNTNTAPVTVSTPVTVTTPVTVSTPVTTTVTMAPTFAPPADAPRMHLVRDDLSAHRTGTRRWLAVGATTEVHHPGQLGARASVDLLQHGHFSLGVAAAVALGESGKGPGEKHGTNGNAVAYLAWSTSIHGFDVRASLGIGAGLGGGAQERHDADGGGTKLSRMTITASGMHGRGGEGGAGVAPRAEAALLLGLPLGHHLGIAAGPVITTSALDHGHGRGDAVDVTLFAGLTYRL